nr:thyroid transcription factor 1-associated protein 26 homolog [Nerophis lumbriciformis]
MAPVDPKTKKSVQERNFKKPQKQNAGVKKRKWIPENKVFQGSIQEGQGFAFKRKEKVRHDYNKLVRKEKKKTDKQTSLSSLYHEEYPDHLKHLYMAEAEKLKNEAWTNRLNRVKLRMKGHDQEEEAELEDKALSDLKSPAAPEAEETETAAPVVERLPLSNRMKKKMDKKSSFQRSQEKYEQIQEKRRKKEEEFQKRKQQREDAIQKYKEKKRETFQMLCKKTKKGQPNLNLQMDYLLQKIQKSSEMSSKN